MSWEPLAGGGVALGLFSLLINGLRKRVDEVEGRLDDKVDKILCEQKHKTDDATFSRHEQDLDEVKKDIKMIARTVTRIEAKLDNGSRK